MKNVSKLKALCTKFFRRGSPSDALKKFTVWELTEDSVTKMRKISFKLSFEKVFFG